MYTVIRSYDLTPGTREEVIQRVQERFVPLLNHVPGFRSYMLMEGGDNNVTSISTFNTLADAKAATRLTQDWHTEQVNVFIQRASKLAAGQVRAQNESARLPSTIQTEEPACC